MVIQVAPDAGDTGQRHHVLELVVCSVKMPDFFVRCIAIGHHQLSPTKTTHKTSFQNACRPEFVTWVRNASSSGIERRSLAYLKPCLQNQTRKPGEFPGAGTHGH